MTTLRIIPLGGSTYVTRNMFVYEIRSNGKISDILIVDCGIGFPDEEMYGVDYLVPDINYLLDKKDKIRGLVLTHGHKDHIGALKYLLPKLGTKIYGTRLTAALAEADLYEFGLKERIQVVDIDRHLALGAFTVFFVHVTHSIPDAANLVIETPVGRVYHGSDFKFDWTPVDNRPTEVEKIVRYAGKDGYLCLLSDCVRSEHPGYTLSERIITDSLQTEIKNTNGKFIFTTFSSNISRIQQAVDVALENNRQICFVGRSLKQNTQVAKKLKYLRYPEKNIVRKHQLNRFRDSQLALIVTGSQGEPGSALTRIAHGEHRFIKIAPEDKVVFSSDPIPGNERSVNETINLLSAQGAEVVYTDIHDELHVSGHAAGKDLQLMLSLTRPKYLVPIGGEYKQMVHLRKLAEEMGYERENIYILEPGQVLEFDEGGNSRLGEKVRVDNIMVDGLGVGDVGNVILRDREKLAEEGFVVVIVPFDTNRQEIAGEIYIVTRGFVFRHEKDSKKLIDRAKKEVYRALKLKKGQRFDWKYYRKKITDQLDSLFYKELKRSPLIVPVLLEV